MIRNAIIEAVQSVGFDEYSEIKSTEIIFSQAVFDTCATNVCGNYGQNYSCPPFSGTMCENQERFLKYDNCIVLNKIVYLGEFYEQMETSAQEVNNMLDQLRIQLKEYPLMIAGPGGCNSCEVCAAKTEEACRFPDQRRYSLEGSGLDVVTLARNLKMTYNGGNHKVGYFMIIMY